MKSHAIAFGLLVLGLILAAYVSGCAPSQAVKERAADGAYLADHMKCVEGHNTNAAINACRADVRRRWGIAETVRDAGGDR